MIVPLKNRPADEVIKAVEAQGYHRHQIQAQGTGEFRRPKAGEWFISGAIPEAYLSVTNQVGDSYFIAKLVITESFPRVVTTVDELLKEDR